MSTRTHLGQVGNREELLQLAHQACDQSLQRCVELCAVLDGKHFLQRQQQELTQFRKKERRCQKRHLMRANDERSSSHACPRTAGVTFRYPEKELPLSRVLLQILDQHHEVCLRFLHFHILLKGKRERHQFCCQEGVRISKIELK